MATESGKSSWICAITAPLLGFLTGWCHAGWQVFIETGQVLAGLVAYPSNNPYYIYHVNAWSLANQICGWLLGAGFSEKSISLAAGGLLGMVAFAAIFGFTYAVSRNAVFSLAVPFLLHVLYDASAVRFGGNYPLWLMGFHAYGILGLTWSLLILALFALERDRAGGLLLGLAPAVHLVWGAYVLALVLAGLAWERTHCVRRCREALPAVLIGLLISTASYVLWQNARPDLPAVDAASSEPYVDAFMRDWDTHRQPVKFVAANFVLGAYCLFLCLYALRLPGRDETLNFLLRVLALSGAFGMAASLMSHLPQELLPRFYLRAMPARLWNLNVLAFMPLLAGLLLRLGGRAVFNLVFLLAVMFAVALAESGYTEETLAESFRAKTLMHLAVYLGAMLSLAGLVWDAENFAKGEATAGLPSAAMKMARGAVILVLSAAVAVSSARAYDAWQSRDSRLRDFGNDAFLAAVARGTGGLLLQDNWYVQGLTRRAILPGPLNALPYIPSVAGEMDRILQTAFGLDLRNPPGEILHRPEKAFPSERIRRLWEARTVEDWRRAGRDLGFTQILTHSGWHLQLPVAAQSDWRGDFPDLLDKRDLILYQIPDSDLQERVTK